MTAISAPEQVQQVQYLQQAVGVLGGMFDPVHNGHLQAARAAREACALSEVRLLPCGNPVHRQAATTATEHRLAMLALACQDEPWLRLDPRECLSDQPSRTYDTLSALKAEEPDKQLYCIIGLDAFNALPSWYRWQELFTLAHLLVVTRPGYRLGDAGGPTDSALLDALAQRQVKLATMLKDQPAGGILLLEANTPAVSSTELRTLLARGEAISSLVPGKVADYIRAHQLYQQAE